MTIKQGLHLGGPATYNGTFNTMFPQSLYDPADKRAQISSHKYRVASMNTRDLFIRVDCDGVCCDCDGADVAPDTEIAMWLIENGGWPKEADGSYSVLPFNGLAHTHTLEKVFWQVLSPKAGFEFEIVLANCEVQPTDPCTGAAVGDPVRNFEGDADLVIGTIDGSLAGCEGDRSGSGIIGAADLPVANGGFLRFNDWIGIRPTAIPDPEEGETAACVWENFGLRISTHQDILCR